jgi:hypothetical protein
LNKNKKLHAAIANNDINSVKFLLQYANVNAGIKFEKNYPIEHAVAKCRTDIIRLLLKDSRVDPSVQSNYALTHSASSGYTNIVELLLKDKRVDPSDDHDWAIRYASINGHWDIVKLLLKDERINPAVDQNRAIIFSYRHYSKITELLWDDQRVKNTLKKDHITLYKKLMKEDVKSKIREF